MATRTPVKAAPVERAASSFGAYDLVLMLDTGVEPKARADILDDVKRNIAADGELLRHDAWGTRALAYPINHREQAEYHLLQFKPAKVALLKDLDRSLAIADEVLRFRIVKIKPGTPDPPDVRARPTASYEANSAAVDPAALTDAAPDADATAEAAEWQLPAADATSAEVVATDDHPEAVVDVPGSEPEEVVAAASTGDAQPELAVEGAEPADAAPLDSA
jgi:small subunit ribosomal protein S6